MQEVYERIRASRGFEEAAEAELEQMLNWNSAPCSIPRVSSVTQSRGRYVLASGRRPTSRTWIRGRR